MSLHYGTPSSYTSDYGVLASYAAARERGQQNVPHGSFHDNLAEGAAADDGRNGDEIDDPPMPRPRFPTPYRAIPATVPSTLPPGMKDAIAHERTPLLIPRIDEEGDCDANANADAERGRWLEEMRILFRYTLPVLGTHLLEYSLVIASVISIGHLSTTALAASTLGSMTASVTGFSIVQGLASTLDTMLPSAWTSDNPRLVGLWAQRMTVVTAVSLIPIYVIWFNAEAILLLLRQDLEVARLAAVYLRYVSIGLPAYAFNGISRRYFQSQGLFSVPTQIILVIAPINAFLNYFLVWGPRPFALGFIGAPLASAISMNLVSIASIAYGTFFVPRTAWHPICRKSFQSLTVLVQLGLAGVGQTASEWWSWELVGLAASLISPEALATQSVLLVSASTTYQAPFALSVATSVRIGNLLGEKNAARAALSSKASLLLTLIFSGISSAVFLIFRKTWGHLFNDDSAVVTLVASILPVVALFQVFDGLSAVTGGILRARGKQFTGALLNLSAYYVIGIPFGIWLAFKRDAGLHGLWYGLTVSLVYSAVAGVYLALTTDWAKEVRKVEERLEESGKIADGEAGNH
ncbi:MATE efflux family protein [Vararia minispora EC-137]|uniref:MATE efflux family protein n=1 Tax=Vararia minispora EC-137 TaxID=1314806 RepID=A0ACB8QJC8_9AGAM|nr:MATE efflux family protein [Vararia minispora EC-137]